MTLQQTIERIMPLNIDAMEEARKRQLSLAKPPGSLGKLEAIAIQMAGITGKTKNTIPKKCVIVACSDNGIVEEGVASTPQSVTLSQSINFVRGKAGVAVIAKAYGSDLFVVDVGINSDIKYEGMIHRKIRKSTWNFAKEPAMTREECVKAIEVGIEMAHEGKKQGYEILGVGEMGIGNTTTSSAVLTALLNLPTEKTVGKGAGLSEEGFTKKKKIIEEAILKYDLVGQDAITIVSHVGGFDIACMAGVFLGAASLKIPVVIDGFISIVAALVAKVLCPEAVSYMICSHESYEIGYKEALKAMELSSHLQLDMRLGEGSGCPIMFMVIEGALKVMNDMATFEEAKINDDYIDGIKEETFFKIKK